MTAPSGQSKKLGIKTGSRVAVVDAPTGWVLQDPPDIVDAPDGNVDILLAFFRAADDLPAALPALGERIFPAGALWILWPRRAAGHVSDLGDNVIREAVLPLGLVDVKVAAVDEDWSGLKIVWRLENRS